MALFSNNHLYFKLAINKCTCRIHYPSIALTPAAAAWPSAALPITFPAPFAAFFMLNAATFCQILY